MLKNIQNLGKPLSKKNQREINGGAGNGRCRTHRDCWDMYPFLGIGDVSCRRPFRGVVDGMCIFN